MVLYYECNENEYYNLVCFWTPSYTGPLDMKYLFYALIFVASFFLTFVSSADGQTFDKGEVYWLTQNIYHEARGESIYGQVMVGMVTLERLKSGRWGNTIKKVVTAPSQFSWHSDGKSDVPDDQVAWDSSKSVALFVIMVYNKTIDHGIMHYHKDDVKPYWADDDKKIMQIDNHIFYKGIK